MLEPVPRNVYCYPLLGRSGLGNCLLPWARAVVFAKAHALPLLAPRWAQLRLGAVLRREKVKRFYFNELSNLNYVRGFRKLCVLATASQVSEDAAEQVIFAGGNDGRDTKVVIFEGLKNYFRDLWHHHSTVRDELYRIVAPRVLRQVQSVKERFIAMHVRRGDATLPHLRALHCTPLSWFVAAARTIRAVPDFCDIPIYVVSDGYENELAELLSVRNCRLATVGSAIGDILLLSRAQMLFASAHSTFSMWGSYLGRMPTLYYPGKMDQNVFPPNATILEGEWNAGQTLPNLQSGVT